MPSMKKQRNIVMLGFSMVGKTTISVRFTTNEFQDSYDPTYENNFNKIYHFKGEDIELRIKDTQGLNSEETLRPDYGFGQHGYVLVYSVDSHQSLKHLIQIHEQLLNLLNAQDAPIVLVGNKADLNSKYREVSYAEGAQVARDWGCSFVECSAKNNLNITQIFDILLQEIEEATGQSSSSCWQCLGNFLRCRGDEAIDLEKLMRVYKWTVAWDLIMGVAALVVGILTALAQKEMDQHQEERMYQDYALLAYLLVVMGVALLLLSVAGVLTLRSNEAIFLKGYGAALAVCILLQLGMAIIIFRLKGLSSSDEWRTLTALTLTLLNQLAAVFICCYNYQVAFGSNMDTTLGEYNPISQFPEYDSSSTDRWSLSRLDSEDTEMMRHREYR